MQKSAQYFDKLKLLGGKDPHELAHFLWIYSQKILPISYFDIVNYVFRQAHTRVPFSSVPLFTFSAANMSGFRIDDM